MKMQTLTPMETALLNTVMQMHRAHQKERAEQLQEITALRARLDMQERRTATLETVITSLAPLWGTSLPPTT